MRIGALHSWDVDTREARRIQAELARRVSRRSPSRLHPRLVAGADMSHLRGDPWLYGAVVVLRLPGFEVVETAIARRKDLFPYVPGYLSFREGPVLIDCFRKLRRRPDVVLFDAQGIAHPRRLGLASHLGLWLGMPSIGCAKTRLCGEADEPEATPGSKSALREDGERIGTLIRTRAGSKPIFVSVGHNISLADAERVVTDCWDGKHRLPEPTRLAHVAVNEYRRKTASGLP